MRQKQLFIFTKPKQEERLNLEQMLNFISSSLYSSETKHLNEKPLRYMKEDHTQHK